VFRILQLWFCEYFVTRWQPRGTKDYRSGVSFSQTCFALEAPCSCTYVYRHILDLPSYPKNLRDARMAVSTLEDVQSVWTDKSSRTNKSSNVRLMCKRVEQIFRRTNRLIFVGLERRFFLDDLSVETNKSTTVRDKFRSDGQIPDDLSVQTICSSSSVKKANVWALKSRCKRTQIAASDICRLQTYGALFGSKSNVLTFCDMNIETVLLLAITF